MFRTQTARYKHGLYSTRGFMLPGESVEEFNELKTQLIEYWQPTGFYEQTTVHQMAGNLWETFRLQAAKNDHILEVRAGIALALPRLRDNAKLNLMAMKTGDQAFFYHSNEGKAVVGVAEVVRKHYPDPAAPGEPWVLVDFKAVKPFPKPVTLAEVKAEPKLAKMALVTLSRLSVQPVTEEEWAVVCGMGGYKG